MQTQEQARQRRGHAADLIGKAGIAISAEERERIEVADFGLDEFERTGLALLVYVNTARCCAKELAMWPRQTCPEHRHPPVGADPGKEETFRCRWGHVFVYLEGERSETITCRPPAGREATDTVWREIELGPGEQCTIPPDTLHWFQAGDEGAVISEFSTRSTDENDIFTDPAIRRLPDAL